MTALAHRLAPIVRNVALTSGLLLFACVAVELCNAAIGLVSLEAMGSFAAWRSAVLPPRIVALIFTTMILAHIATTLRCTVFRSTVNMPALDAVVILSGALVPFLLLPYLVDTTAAGVLFGVSDDTLYRLAKLWPEHAFIYTALLVLLWVHGCLGIYLAMRLKPSYMRFGPVLAVTAIALPIAAIAGIIASARVVSVLMADEALAGQVRAATNWPSVDAENSLSRVRLVLISCYGAVLVLAAAALVIRFLRIVVAPKIDVSYVGGPTLNVAVGPTLLEMSQIKGVAHANACGGRGRCTSCSVRIEHAAERLPSRNAFEVAMVGQQDETIRLACQIRPTAALTVSLLAAPEAAMADPNLDVTGVDCELVVLCVAMRDHAALARQQAAYDAIFLLNEFLDAVHAAIATHDGWTLGTIIGNRLVAVFGRGTSTSAACEAAIGASADIDVALDRLNERFAAELGRPIAVAMGLALGPTYLGRVGWGSSKALTAIGPAVDMACALAQQAEHRGDQLLADEAILKQARIDTDPFELVPLTTGTGNHNAVAVVRARIDPRATDLNVRTNISVGQTFHFSLSDFAKLFFRGPIR